MAGPDVAQRLDNKSNVVSLVTLPGFALVAWKGRVSSAMASSMRGMASARLQLRNVPLLVSSVFRNRCPSVETR